jgi:Holliday junction resolvasome RuvABC endonuclease subunit
VLTAWCEDNNIPYQGVSVGTIKKFATGSGNADKNAVKRAVREKWGFKPKDDDEADALALLHFLLYEVMN